MWNNSIATDPTSGRVRICGWNVEAGYLPGDDSSAFSRVDDLSHAVVSGDRGVWHGDLLCLAGRTDAVVKVRRVTAT